LRRGPLGAACGDEQIVLSARRQRAPPETESQSIFSHSEPARAFPGPVLFRVPGAV